ncbi:hypothetical protein [Wenyingzhuangia sp. IMCC45467]
MKKDIEEKLLELSKTENQLYEAIIELSKKERTKSSLGLSQYEIFESYSEIHTRYTNLSVESLEALKRAIFIQWFSISEPDFLSGIRELDNESIHKTLMNIEKVLKNKSADTELLWMLNYYFEWDFLFDNYIETFDYKKYNLEKFNLPETFEYHDRGQMGDYWNSIINK